MPSINPRDTIAVALDAIRKAQLDLSFLGGCTHTDRPDLPLAPDTSWITDVTPTLAALDSAAAGLQRDLTASIVTEVYSAMERLGAQPDLLSVIGSWRDTMNDDDILDMLRVWNAGGEVIEEIHAHH